jgi:hypothetical protein
MYQKELYLEEALKVNDINQNATAITMIPPSKLKLSTALLFV